MKDLSDYARKMEERMRGGVSPVVVRISVF